MKQIVQAATAAGALELIGRTETAGRIIDEAARRAEAAADFLEGIEDFLTEDKRNDISM